MYDRKTLDMMNDGEENMVADPDNLTDNQKEWQRIEDRLNALLGAKEQQADRLYHLSERLDEQGGDYEGDPLAGHREKLDEIDMLIKGYNEKQQAVEAKFTEAEKKVHEAISEYLSDMASEDAADRRTRWEESGRPCDFCDFG